MFDLPKWLSKPIKEYPYLTLGAIIATLIAAGYFTFYIPRVTPVFSDTLIIVLISVALFSLGVIAQIYSSRLSVGNESRSNTKRDLDLVEGIRLFVDFVQQVDKEKIRHAILWRVLPAELTAEYLNSEEGREYIDKYNKIIASFVAGGPDNKEYWDETIFGTFEDRPRDKDTQERLRDYRAASWERVKTLYFDQTPTTCRIGLAVQGAPDWVIILAASATAVSAPDEYLCCLRFDCSNKGRPNDGVFTTEPQAIAREAEAFRDVRYALKQNGRWYDAGDYKINDWKNGVAATVKAHILNGDYSN